MEKERLHKKSVFGSSFVLVEERENQDLVCWRGSETAEKNE